MLYELGGAQCRPGQIALLRGGQPHAALDLVLQAIQVPSLLLADQAYVETLAATRAATTRPRLDLQISRGLAADFAAINRGRSEHPVIVTASALTGDIALNIALVGEQFAIVGGYQVSPVLIETFVKARLVETLTKCAQQQAAPVIVHDGLKLLDLRLVAGAVRIEMGDPSDAQRKGSSAASMVDAKPYIEPTREQVRGHAQFLATTPLPILTAMHAFMRGPSAAMIVNYWQAKFNALATAEPSDAALVAQALQQLGDLDLDQGEGAANARAKGKPRMARANIVPASQVNAMLASAGAIALTAHGPTASQTTTAHATHNGSGVDKPQTNDNETKPDMSLIYGKPGQPRAATKAADINLDLFGTDKKSRPATAATSRMRTVTEAEHKAVIAKIVRDVEAAAATVSKDAIAQAIRKVEASAALEREQAIAAAVQYAVATAEHANAIKFAAATEEAQAKANASIATAAEQAKRDAQATTADEIRNAVTAAVDKATTLAEREKAAVLQVAQAAADKATKHAVTTAIRAAEAAADSAKAQAVDNAIARTTALAEQARIQAVAEALEQAAAKANQLRVAAVQEAVAATKVSAEIEKVAAVEEGIALTKCVMEEDYEQVLAAALAEAEAAAEVSRGAAVARAIATAEVAAEVAKTTAIERAVAITQGLAQRDQDAVVAQALSLAAVDAERAKDVAIAQAVARAEHAAERAKATAVEQAVAQMAREAAVSQQAAIALALDEAEWAAQARAQAQAIAITDLKSRVDAEFVAALERRRERISKMTLAEIETEMSSADHAWRGKEMSVRCCSLLRAMRQTSGHTLSQPLFVETAASRLKEDYDSKLRSALAQMAMRVAGNGGLVTVIFSVSSVGRTDDVRVVKTSGDAQLDAAAIGTMKRAVFPAPPLEVGGDIAYTALLHFA